jgi:PPP family 3-phenylpropionic acid transporter
MNPAARISLYYVTQFLPAGAAHAYAGIWLSSHGLNGFEISVVSTFPILVILASNVFVGRLADKARDWRSSLQILSLVFLVFTAGLFWAEGFWPILLCFAGFNVAGALAAPIGDAAALHLTSQGRGHIGTLRGFATTGYILALFMTGYAAESFGSVAFIALSLGFALVRLFASLFLPAFKTNEEVTVPQLRTGYRALLKPHLFWPLASWSVSYATILALNSYMSLHLKQEGYDAKAISWLIAIGAFTEC